MKHRRLRMIIDNLHDIAELSATSEGMPIEFTQRSGRSYVWRSSDTQEQVIEAALPEGRFVDGVAVLNHNLSVNSRVVIELLLDDVVVAVSGEIRPSEVKPLGQFVFGVDPWGASDLSVLPQKQFVWWLDDITLCNGYRITIGDEDNQEGFLQIGRIFAGQAYSPKFNPAYGLTLEWQDFGEHRRTEGGSLRTIGQGSARRLSFDLDLIETRGRDELSRQFVRYGKEQDIYVNVYPTQRGIKEAEHAFVARRDATYRHQHDYYGNWAMRFAFLET